MTKREINKAIDFLITDLENKILSFDDITNENEEHFEKINGIKNKTIGVLNNVIEKLKVGKDRIDNNDELYAAVITAEKKSNKLYEEAIRKIDDIRNNVEDSTFYELKHDEHAPIPKIREIENKQDVEVENNTEEESISEVIVEENQTEKFVKEEVEEKTAFDDLDDISKESIITLNKWLNNGENI